MTITVLRFAPLFGPGVHTFYTRIFDHRVVPVLMGYDPLVQLLHPDDALRAAELAHRRGAPRGAFNVVPSRPIPLATALHLAAKVPVPVPHPVAYAGRGRAVGDRGRRRRRARSSTSCATRSWPTARRRRASWGSRPRTPAATHWTPTWRTATRARRRRRRRRRREGSEGRPAATAVRRGGRAHAGTSSTFPQPSPGSASPRPSSPGPSGFSSDGTPSGFGFEDLLR